MEHLLTQLGRPFRWLADLIRQRMTLQLEHNLRVADEHRAALRAIQESLVESMQQIRLRSREGVMAPGADHKADAAVVRAATLAAETDDVELGTAVVEGTGRNRDRADPPSEGQRGRR